MENAPDAPLDEMLFYYKERGCKGVGEVCANMPFDHPMMENLFRCCEKTGMVLTFHLSPTIGGNYGIYDEPGLPLLEKALGKFPDLIFLGHSQPFWAEIGVVDPKERNGYPAGPIEKPGRVVELMRRYPNLHGDLSARSGFNAVSRDPVFGCEFMDEFQEKLYFGTDICAPGTETWLVDFLLTMRREKKISEDVFEKIAKSNAQKLLGLS